MSGNNLIRFLMTSRGVINLLSRGCDIIKRFGVAPDKMVSALSQWNGLAKKMGVRATFPVTAVIIERYPTAIKRFQGNGMIYAVHGYKHIDYSLLSKDEQRAHFSEARSIFKSNGIEFSGFRAPYTRWDAATLEAIGELGFKWESSKTVLWEIEVKDYCNNPLRLKAYNKAVELYHPDSADAQKVLPEARGSYIEIPVSLPDDEMLIDRLRLSSRQVEGIWLNILAQSYARGELFVLQVHPERIPLCKKALEQVILGAKKRVPPVWVATLDEIADWWAGKSGSNVEIKHRWPFGARSCLSITGDIDALTLGDFLLRAIGK